MLIQLRRVVEEKLGQRIQTPKHDETVERWKYTAFAAKQPAYITKKNGWSLPKICAKKQC